MSGEVLPRTYNDWQKWAGLLLHVKGCVMVKFQHVCQPMIVHGVETPLILLGKTKFLFKHLKLAVAFTMPMPLLRKTANINISWEVSLPLCFLSTHFLPTDLIKAPYVMPGTCSFCTFPEVSLAEKILYLTSKFYFFT